MSYTIRAEWTVLNELTFKLNVNELNELTFGLNVTELNELTFGLNVTDVNELTFETNVTELNELTFDTREDWNSQHFEGCLNLPKLGWKLEYWRRGVQISLNWVGCRQLIQDVTRGSALTISKPSHTN